jgi:hypothetical protein
VSSLPLLLLEVRLFKAVRCLLPHSIAMVWAYSILEAFTEREARART